MVPEQIAIKQSPPGGSDSRAVSFPRPQGAPRARAEGPLAQPGPAVGGWWGQTLRAQSPAPLPGTDRPDLDTGLLLKQACLQLRGRTGWRHLASAVWHRSGIRHQVAMTSVTMDGLPCRCWCRGGRRQAVLLRPGSPPPPHSAPRCQPERTTEEEQITIES